MTLVPIPNAITVVRTSVCGALSSLVGTHEGLPRCYWLAARQGAPMPLLVVQSQDSGGKDASFINLGGWEGLITIRAIAESLTAAETLLSGVPAALHALANPAGYTIKATFSRPLVVPPVNDVWQAAQIYRVQLFRST